MKMFAPPAGEELIFQKSLPIPLMWAIMTTSMYCGVKLVATSNHAPEKAFVGKRHWRGTS